MANDTRKKRLVDNQQVQAAQIIHGSLTMNDTSGRLEKSLRMGKDLLGGAPLKACEPPFYMPLIWGLPR